MKPYKTSKIKTTMYRLEYKVESQGLKERYGYEGVPFYPMYRSGFKNPTKQIMSYQIRMYKTWKHNRYTQWK